VGGVRVAVTTIDNSIRVINSSRFLFEMLSWIMLKGKYVSLREDWTISSMSLISRKSCIIQKNMKKEVLSQDELTNCYLGMFNTMPYTSQFDSPQIYQHFHQSDSNWRCAIAGSSENFVFSF
jgi:hypothetical protein